MLKQKKILYLATAVLALLVLLLCMLHMEQGSAPFSVQVTSDGHTETIALWEKVEGKYYVFLPAYAKPEQVQIRLNTENPVKLGGTELKNGISCESFRTETPYELTYSAWGWEKRHTVTFMRSANIPAMYVNTQSGTMDYIHEKKGNEESGTMRLYTGEGTLDYSGQLGSINGRGNATWTDAEKKPYSLELLEEANLLEMGTAHKWILLSNALDSSNLRNKIVYDFSRDVGLPYSPDAEWVDLYLNGEYAGLYLLCERNEVHPNRVDIAKSGSFLVSLELEERLVAQNYNYITTKTGQALRIHYPQEVSVQLLAELSAQWQSVENAMLAEDGIDYVTGMNWQELIDLDSWVKKYLIEEIFGSIDACLISQYFYADGTESSERIYAGPVWDFDISMGNRIRWELLNPRTFHANQFREGDGYITPWFFKLYQKDVFYGRVVELYRSEFYPMLVEEMPSRIHHYVQYISQAAAMNQLRWEAEVDDFCKETEYIIDYMQKRLGFLNDIWCENTEYCFIYADYGLDCCYAVLPGECFSDLYDFGAQDYGVFQGWYYAGTDEPVDIARPITEDVHIYTKWQHVKESNRMRQLMILLPLGIIAVMGVVLLIVDIKRMRKSR